MMNAHSQPEKPPSILYVTRKFPPSIGGMQTQSYGFYHALKRRTHVSLISWGRSQKFLPWFALLAALKSIRRLSAQPLHVVQLGDLVLSPLGRLLKLGYRGKVLSMSHGKDTSTDLAFYRHLVLGSAKELDGIICVSDFLREQLIQKGMAPDRLFTNPNGIDFARYETLPKKTTARHHVEERLSISLQGKSILLSVSRLVKKKGIAEFVRTILPQVVEAAPNVLFVSVGTPPTKEARTEKERILRFLQQSDLKEKALFVEDIPHDAPLLNHLYRASDLFVMPNRHVEGDYEGFGIVSLEASAHEIPVVAFGVDGIPSGVHSEKNGILLPEGDDLAFARTVIDLLGNEDKRKALGEKGRAFVRDHYDWDVIVRRYLDILGQIQ